MPSELPIQNIAKCVRSLKAKKPRFVLAVSGGVDSVVLLHAALQSLNKSQIIIAHFNHRTRENESELDALFVRNLAKTYGLKCIVGNRVGKSASEAALRKERMSFLKKVLTQTSSHYVLLAHHLDDQIETFFLRFIRGTSLAGFRGMKRKRGVFIRPFLTISKNTLSQYAEEKNLLYRVDASNFSSQYFRNRIRHELVPIFQSLVTAHGSQGAWNRRFLQLTKEAVAYKQEQRKKFALFWEKQVHTTPFWNWFSLPAFALLQRQERISTAFQLLKKMTPVEVTQKDALRFSRTLLQHKNGHFPGGLELVCSLGKAFLSTPQQRSQLTKVRQPQIFLESKKRQKNLEFRFAKPGDRKGNTKLKKLFLEKRIPQPERAIIPVLAHQKSAKVVWFFPEEYPQKNALRVKFPYSFLSSPSR